ncbi:D-alanyl-D-alanine carboxypeptidase/D-alanyl-D-alanine-endopeptidase [Pelomonas sp. KK5]|uniref:D-alanyl-D-alanine carboxypeptidase/D-alanyl-D-alanine endopeptidase n=1 Tax=Pelomonas sp. KK5 TaxID=1855730 RepID=UPI00097BF8DF|nr:D-alanyl-D-alanine carboxypeptidase/D-alanyl-D-alanine-endopeptidase [Pelomonas sp. KK5]
MKRALTILAAALALSGCASLRGPAVPEEVTKAMADAGLPMSALGVVAYPIEDRSHLLRLNADVPMSPASTMKLVTGAVALDRLGTNSRSRTDLLIDPAQLNGEGVLAGPLYLRGGADTDLDWGALGQLLRDLRERGVREIQGGLVVDRTLFRPARLDIGLPPFDASPEAYYNVIPDALYLNGNLLGYALKSSVSQVQAATAPAWPGITVDSSAMTLVDAACKDWEKGWKAPLVLPLPPANAAAQTQHVLLQGTFPKQCEQREDFTNLVDRQWLTAQAVRQIWGELGGRIGGSAGTDTEAATPPEAKVQATHLGRPMAEWMRGMMKRSDNGLTRLTFLHLGAAAAAPGEDTLPAAKRVVTDWFAAHGIDATGLVLDNGSGLSRSERIKPVQMAALLQAAHDGPQGPELLAMLPVAGVDGTLRRRMKGTPAEGHARMKTGTLRDTFALAGYVSDAHGRLWIVVGMINDENGEKGKPALDALAAWVARQ